MTDVNKMTPIIGPIGESLAVELQSSTLSPEQAAFLLRPHLATMAQEEHALVISPRGDGTPIYYISTSTTDFGTVIAEHSHQRLGLPDFDSAEAILARQRLARSKDQDR